LEDRQVKNIDKEGSGRESERSLDPHFIRSLATHGLTGDEMKRIFQEIRLRWWKKEPRRVRKDLG
jgi:hypothetical protein